MPAYCSMKTFLLALCLSGPAPKAPAPVIFDYHKLRYGNAPAQTTKAELLKLLGQPKRITQPKYECGFLSADEQKQAYYSLAYGPAVFTGNAKAGYVLDRVKLQPGAKPLRYGQHVWSATTTQHEIEQQFNVVPDPTAKPQPDGSTILGVRTEGDDGATFIFKKGRLVEFQYWSPC